MAETVTQSPPANRTKLVLIPILGAVLLYVVFTPAEQSEVPQLVARPATPAPTPSTPPTSPSIALTTASPPATTAQKTRTTVTWPSVPLAQVMAINPFQMLPGLKSPTVELAEQPPRGAIDPNLAERQEERSAQLRAMTKSYRVTALVQTSKGVGAMIGDRVVVVGDVLDERVRISAIREEGIVLELIESPATSESSALPTDLR